MHEFLTNPLRAALFKGRLYCHFHFTVKETEAERVNCKIHTTNKCQKWVSSKVLLGNLQSKFLMLY